MTKMRKRKIKKAAFYIRREIVRWTVMFAVGLGALCLAVFLLEETNSRWIIEAALAFFAVLYVGDKFYSKKEDSE